MPHPVSPLAPKSLVTPPAVGGVSFATAEAGIRYANRTDVLLVGLEPGTSAAGVFTTSRCPSAAVDWCKQVLPAGVARGLLVNSGNANAFTGQKGRSSVNASAAYAAAALGCDESEIFLASTGVIGEPLDPEKFAMVTRDMAGRLQPGPWLDAARAIMTTDTFPKLAFRTIDGGGAPINIVGIAKGSGMIAPDMATMLSFVFTDAPVDRATLQMLLWDKVSTSFNAITVDSDTSTSDTLLAFATGKAKVPPITLSTEAGQRFNAALGELLFDLAMQVIRDGEGASKLVTVRVEGATGNTSARRIALSIANSPLVKTAIAGEDANWGRVVMAVGKAGEPADRDRLSIWFGPHLVASSGERATGYDEAAVSAYMKGEKLEIKVALGMGAGEAVIYTCDLTHGYIDINGSYRS